MLVLDLKGVTLTHKKQEHGKLIGLGGPYGGTKLLIFGEVCVQYKWTPKDSRWTYWNSMWKYNFVPALWNAFIFSFCGMQMQYVVQHEVHWLAHSAININAVEGSEDMPSVEKELYYFEDQGL